MTDVAHNLRRQATYLLNMAIGALKRDDRTLGQQLTEHALHLLEEADRTASSSFEAIQTDLHQHSEKAEHNQ